MKRAHESLHVIILNGLFSMSEIAVVSSRAARLQRLSDEGRHGAGRALALHKAPSTFLSTIQVGITSVGILGGVVGESAFVGPLAERIGRIPAEADHFDVAGLRFEIVDMDRNRIDKLIVAHAPESD